MPNIHLKCLIFSVKVFNIFSQAFNILSESFQYLLSSSTQVIYQHILIIFLYIYIANILVNRFVIQTNSSAGTIENFEP